MDRIVEKIKKRFADHENRDRIVAQYQVFYGLAGMLSTVLPRKVLIQSVIHASKKLEKTITFIAAKENEMSHDEMEDALARAWYEDEVEAIEIDKQ